MKKFVTTLLFFFSFILSIHLQAQNVDASGGCTSATIHNSGVSYPLVYDGFNCEIKNPNFECWSEETCIVWMIGVHQLKPKITLQKFDFDSRNWFTVRGPFKVNLPHTEQNLDKGTYRFKVQYPELRLDCGDLHPKGDPWTIGNLVNGQLIGNAGTYDFSPTLTSMIVAVGATDDSDISMNLIDNTGIPGGFYSYEQEIILDGSGSKNYSSYFISVFKDSGPGPGFASAGWTRDIIDTRSISNIWLQENNPDIIGDPEEFSTYHVQFAITNHWCPTNPWTVIERTIDGGNIICNGACFTVCPDGLGCRFGGGAKLKKAILSPNPANNTITINDFDYNFHKEYSIAIADLSGKRLVNIPKWSNTSIDVSNVPEGMYILNLFENDKKIITEKLVINH